MLTNIKQKTIIFFFGGTVPLSTEMTRIRDRNHYIIIIAEQIVPNI